MIGFFLGLIGCGILLFSFSEPMLGELISIGVGVACMLLSFGFRKKYEEYRYSFHPFNKANKRSARFWFSAAIPLVLIPVVWIAYGP